MTQSAELKQHLQWQVTMGKVPVDGQYVEQALQEIRSGKDSTTTYPNGAPTLRATYALAAQLEQAASSVQ